MSHIDTSIVESLRDTHTLPDEALEELLETDDEALLRRLREAALSVKRSVKGEEILRRGLIEWSNICRNDCLYCGIRRSNSRAERYRLTPEEVFSCCETGYALGFRTFVLQGGEDAYFTDERLVPLVHEIRARWPDCAITLSLGERQEESYKALRAAGADRYLLRHETADPEHYARLHPPELSWERRMNCLKVLRETGFQTGCGFMVGSPFQQVKDLVRDLCFVQDFQPAMCGIGPFIPQKDTPFGGEPAGSVDMTLFLLSLLRLIRPGLLLPATTALGSLVSDGRERGILAGANVVMPNLSPREVRKKYLLYDNKLATGVESAEGLCALNRRMESIGYRIVTARGDAPC